MPAAVLYCPFGGRHRRDCRAHRILIGRPRNRYTSAEHTVTARRSPSSSRSRLARQTGRRLALGRVPTRYRDTCTRNLYVRARKTRLSSRRLRLTIADRYAIEGRRPWRLWRTSKNAPFFTCSIFGIAEETIGNSRSDDRRKTDRHGVQCAQVLAQHAYHTVKHVTREYVN